MNGSAVVTHAGRRVGRGVMPRGPSRLNDRGSPIHGKRTPGGWKNAAPEGRANFDSEAPYVPA